MDKSKYQQHALATNASEFSTNGPHLMANYPSNFNQFDVDNIDAPKHICPVCNKTFRASSLLDIHMRVHVGAKPFVCPVCNHRATQKGNLKLHMKKHHGLDLPSHIDLVPDSGIWGNFPQNPTLDEMQLANKKRTALAHSSLLDDETVNLIKKCQNNIGQSTMGRITESLNDFLDMAQQKVQNCEAGSKPVSQNSQPHPEQVGFTSNNFQMQQVSVSSSSAVLEKSLSFHEVNQTDERFTGADTSQKNYCFCKICGWKTTSPGYLNVHMRKHKAETHVCNICGRGFKETWYLKNHMRSHIHSLTTDVESLQAENRRNAELKLNQDAPPEDDERYKHDANDRKASCAMCSGCGLVFSKKLIEQHYRKCGVVASASEDCKLCDNTDENQKQVFTQSLGLTAKVIEKEPTENLKSFNSIIGSRAVSLTSNGPNKTLSENIENRSYILKQEILRSIRRNGFEATKINFEKFMTNPSFKVLMNPEDLNSIAELFGKQKSSPQIDSKPSVTQNSTNTSESAMATKPYRNAAMQSLAEIGKSLQASNAENIPFTMENNNEGEFQGQGFQCQFCSKWFKYRSVLGIHMRSHTGERPYKCGLCGYAGTQHNCLKLHMQRHHPQHTAMNESKPLNLNNEETSPDIEQEHMLLGQAAKFNPAKCPVCARVSPSPGYLKIHMRSHKQTLDHVCPICGRGFKEYWYLATHLRTHDQEVIVPRTQPNQQPANVLLPKQSSNKMITSIDLTKRQNLPVIETKTSFVSSSSSQSSSSWSPLNVHEDLKEGKQLIVTQSQNIEPSRQPYISKRKAFQPARYRAEPYSRVEPATRSRKSKPRKLSQGSYLAPVFQKLPSSDDSLECERKVSYLLNFLIIFENLFPP